MMESDIEGKKFLLHISVAEVFHSGASTSLLCMIIDTIKRKLIIKTYLNKLHISQVRITQK